MRDLVLLLASGAAATGCARGASAGRAPDAAGAPQPAPAVAQWARMADSLLGDARFANSRWGVLVVHPESGDTLYARDADRLFMPASNQKILTGAVGLAVLGGEYRWRTTFAARGVVRHGVLDGDLVVVGRGDPSVSDRMRGDAMAPLGAVADSLVARGIRRITGRVVSAGDAFPDAPWGFGWGWDDFDAPYSAGVDELLFNEGFSRVVVRGGVRAGDPAAVVTAPAAGVPPIVARVTTVAPPFAPTPPGSSASRVTVRWSADPAAYVLEGTLVAGDSVARQLAHRDPGAAYLAALGQALAARGVGVGGSAAVRKAVAARAPAGTPDDTLFTLLSPPLREVLPALEKPSQNQIAEALFKTLGLERTGVGTADSGRRVVERQLAAWGVDTVRDVAVRDGSGLSRHDYVTPRALVRVLDAMRRHPEFRAFYDALPVAGVDGTIAGRMRGTPAERNVRAKTGTVDKARSLSGYVTTADGEMLLFSLLSNNHTVPTRLVDATVDTLVARLAGMRLGGTLARPTASAVPGGR